MTLFQGKYNIRNPNKYINQKGLQNICYRSSWEKSVMIFLDNNPKVKLWGSEEIAIPYINENDGKVHRYFIDFYVELVNGKRYLIEIKPYCQTQSPKKTPKKVLAKYLNECTTFVTNMSKWKYAKEFASKNNMVFQIWTEHDLQKLGININCSKKFRYVNYAKSKKTGKRKTRITKS